VQDAAPAESLPELREVCGAVYEEVQRYPEERVLDLTIVPSITNPLKSVVNAYLYRDHILVHKEDWVFDEPIFRERCGRSVHGKSRP
jgi:hypothetical protein